MTRTRLGARSLALGAVVSAGLALLAAPASAAPPSFTPACPESGNSMFWCNATDSTGQPAPNIYTYTWTPVRNAVLITSTGVGITGRCAPNNGTFQVDLTISDSTGSTTVRSAAWRCRGGIIM